jgi:DNA repair exonuclease SbcCD nuclease subunit
MKKQLKKAACFTDIHWGAKTNSELHNQDCLNFIEWFCAQVKKDKEIDHICFLGDWFENRSAINVSTINYSYRGAKLLNELNLPIFFVVGNHDLYHRHTREIHSVVNFKEFTNFKIIDDPIIIPEIGDGGAVFSPYLFHEEYPQLTKLLNYKTWWGHFEFKGFVVTGYNIILPTGPDPKDYLGPKRIFSGHFHKRQEELHVQYIGNVFPTTFGDANDVNRGMMIYDHETDKVQYKNWENCPKYLKFKLSDILDKSVKFYENARVKCVADIPISFEDSTHLRQTFLKKYKLREFTMEESYEIKAALTETETFIDISNSTTLDSVDNLVIEMLKDIKSEHINNDILIEEYRKIKV